MLENHTLHSGTYLYSPYMAVPPSPLGGIYHVERGDPYETIALSGMVLHKDITYPVTCSICSPLFFKAQMRSDILLQEPVNFAIIFESFASMGQNIFLQNSKLFKKCLPLENWKSAIAKR